ncbi:MAG TPA: hypothetical protein DCP97_00495 [Ruminococcaceae bacterium]|nr:hypothetical protein [Oscillospiraceae bacterium]
MTVYFINIAIILILGILMCEIKPNKIKTSAYLAICYASLTLVSGLRYGIGFDYYSYINVFRQTSKLSFAKLLDAPVEPGFAIILKIISLFTDNAYAMHFALSAIVNGVLILFVLLYVKRGQWLAVGSYVMLSLNYYGTFNLIRQYFAAIISLYAIVYLMRRKPVQFFAFVLVAASVHKTALILLPLYIVASLDLNWKTLTLYGTAALGFYAFSIEILKFVTKYAFKDYNPETSMYMTMNLSLIFAVIPFIVALAAYLLKGSLLKLDKGNIVLVNFAFYNFIFYFFATKHYITERLSTYFFISTVLLIPQIVDVFRIDEGSLKKLEELKLAANEKGINPTLQKKRMQSYTEFNESLKDSRSFYRFSLALIIFVFFLGHQFAVSTTYHRVFPKYYSIFDNQQQIDEMVNKTYGSVIYK